MLGFYKASLVTLDNLVNTPKVFENVLPETKPSLPPGIEPLVLWEPEGPDEENEHLTRIEVDPLLVCYLRPHQRLGKTLQSITLLYTLLCQGFDGKPMVKRALIVTPTSLVSNWESEIYKWVGRRIQLLSLCESTRADVVSGIDSFLGPSTPFQNDLEEFFAMVNFTNPGILGDASYFSRYYEVT
ncbi:hypothetical protein J5N97_009761 [Dioscorea zingiberensis]|uniref:SNF2 N-terminal domain-containing protein n=1 Tax=Dioscorea zingiberensis TaxID=325984 RepID=A0A9D5CXS7_9LILI|nr:hypothetical protein J5N97_009761 [Dioscorea zingiberensis]